MDMTQDIKIGTTVLHKSGYIKGTGVVIRRMDGMYEVLWQNRSIKQGRFEHCRSSLVKFSRDTTC